MSDINYPSRALNSATDSVTIAGTIIATNPSVAPTGAAVPADATYVAVDVGGNLTGLTGTANGLKVDGSAVTQPVSGSVTVTQATAANLNATVSQPTAANLNATVSQPTAANLNATVTGTVAATQSGTWNVNNVSGTVSLPTGAATSAKQPALGTAGTASTDVITVQGIAGATAVKVDASGTTVQVTGIVSVQGVVGGPAVTVNQTGRSSISLIRNNYAVTPVTTGAYVQILASTSAVINRLYIFDSSGSAIILATGAAGSEIDKLYIGPGGNDAPYELAIPINTRISLKALDTNASVGQFVLTALN
jgi:hypothetical protein